MDKSVVSKETSNESDKDATQKKSDLEKTGIVGNWRFAFTSGLVFAGVILRVLRIAVLH